MLGIAIIFPILILIVFGIPILIGVYVYRDATRRGMNALLWTLIAVFAPSLIGFIIYLIIRGNYSDLKCLRCGTPVTEQYVVCPKCGVKLKASCPNCSAPVESDWELCPICTTPLPEQYEDVEPPQRAKDKTLGKVLLVLIIVPVLLIALIISGMVAYIAHSGGGGGSMITETDFTTLYGTQETSDVENWLESLDDNGMAYAMQYTTTNPAGDNLYYYLLYVPGAGKDAFSGTEMAYGGFFSDVYRVKFAKGETDKQTVYCIESYSDKVQKLEVYLDGQKLDCEITKVDFNPIQNIIRDADDDATVPFTTSTTIFQCDDIGYCRRQWS